MAYTTTDVHAHGTGQHAPVCYCPACLGLQCLERPRYFSGQLLTEAELNSEQAYQIAKNKLHNRYLHGWGVVCGLQVVCHDCEGWVTVREGYALDPCGNDIIVCEDQPFDVMKKIRECVEGRRRRRRYDCDPLKPYDDPLCDELEEHWCVTIAYEEKEARPITALRPEKACGCGAGCGCGSGCGCGCGGKSNGNGHAKAKKGGCGCGGGKAATPGPAVQTQGGVGLSVAACEPTRVYERFRLDVVERPDHCVPGYTWFDERTMGQTHFKYLNLITNDETRETIIRYLKVAPRDSAFVRVIECFLSLAAFVEKRIPQQDLSNFFSLFEECARLRGSDDQDNASGAVANEGPSEDLYRLCCILQKLVRDLYEENPFNVHCDPRCAPCTPVQPPSNDTSIPGGGSGNTGQTSDAQLSETLCCLVERLVQYFIDCVCQVLLVPCPPSPQDDRVVLACLTIRKGKIVDICNFSCRHYAGSFPAVKHWLSLFPVLPLIGRGVARFCCDFNLLDYLSGVGGRRRVVTGESFRGTAAAEEAGGGGGGDDGGDVFAPLREMGHAAAELLDRASFSGMRRRARGARQQRAAYPHGEAAEVKELREQVEAMRREIDELKKR